ncbi:Lrp/AsnC family transcriptional regulator [Kocuria rhizophila]|uniref:Lrp/AsnC family transcriptional regulator n=1 Tax=Kocuria rhizophila TaxID=72000 RepID=UPI003D6E3EED
MSVPLDRIDRELVKALSRSGRATFAELGQEVRLSANTVAERVRRLRRAGVISRFTVDVDAALLGKPLGVLSDVKLRDGVERIPFAQRLSTVPEVVGALRLTGEYDYQLHIVAADTAELESLIELLKREFGVASVNSRLILREVPVDKARLLDAR